MTQLLFLCPDKSSISDYDLDILHPFGMKIRNNLTVSTFHEMSYNFSKAGMENLAKTRSHVRALSRFEPMIFACCINSCICYASPYADLDKCPKCETSRLNESGRARRTSSQKVTKVYLSLPCHSEATFSTWPTFLSASLI